MAGLGCDVSDSEYQLCSYTLQTLNLSQHPCSTAANKTPCDWLKLVLDVPARAVEVLLRLPLRDLSGFFKGFRGSGFLQENRGFLYRNPFLSLLGPLKGTLKGALSSRPQ